jgi:hypothetical protein
VPERYRLHAAPARGLADRGATANRAEIRKPTFIVAAMIFARDLHAPLPCTVRDLSQKGARIELDYHGLKPSKVHVELPQRLLLRLCPLKMTFVCRLAWREGRHFGVEFVHRLRVRR